MPVRVTFANVTTPLAAVTVVVPPSVPPAPDWIAIVTCVVLSVVTVLPSASSTRTTGCVASTAPLAPPTGCVVIASCVAAPAVTVTLFESASVSPVAVNRST